jgi:hypothetical protein
MISQYKTFLIHSGAEPLSETLLGRTTHWHATATMSYLRPNQSVVELTRFRLSCMKFDDQGVAKWFGLELARLVVDSCYRELVAERYENEKRHIQQTRRKR